MRVLHWNEGWLPFIGGTEVLLHDLTAEQQRRGHIVAALCDRSVASLAPRESMKGVDIHRLSLCESLRSGSPAAIARTVTQVAATVRDLRPDVLHVHLNGPSLWFQLLTRNAHPAPVLVTLHTPFERLALPPELRDRLLRQAGWITAVSEALLDELHRLYPDGASRSSAVWNALSDPDGPRYPPSFDPPRLVAAGRLVHDKGFDTAIRAVARLLPRYPQLQLHIVGDGTERASLERRAAELPSGAVRFSGWIKPDQMPAVFRDSSIVLIPSRWNEPFGLVALQAAQQARPVVACRVGGLPEIVNDGTTGRLVPRDDDAAMADAIANLISDPEGAARMGQAARERVAERFSLRSCADRYDALYHRLTGA